MNAFDVVDDILNGNPDGVSEIYLNSLRPVETALIQPDAEGLNLVLTLPKPLAFFVEEPKTDRDLFYLSASDIQIDLQVEIEKNEKRYVIEDELNITDYLSFVQNFSVPGTYGGVDSLSDALEAIFESTIAILREISENEADTRIDPSYYIEIAGQNDFRRALSSWAERLSIDTNLDDSEVSRI